MGASLSIVGFERPTFSISPMALKWSPGEDVLGGGCVETRELLQLL
jgi:hypothetical protein